MYETASIAVQRFGLGAKPGEIRAAVADPYEYLLSQFEIQNEGHFAQLPNSSDALSEFRRFRAGPSKVAREKAAKGESASKGSMRNLKNPANNVYRREVFARLQNFSDTQTPFIERLSQFWANHFAISARRPDVSSMAGAYEREAIRPHIDGNFSDMLIAATVHPAMLLFLNGSTSVGPNSRLGKRKNLGLNENHAREILELHTLGTEGGYSTRDIRELAKSLTGWTVSGPTAKGYAQNASIFVPTRHEPGNREVLKKKYVFSGSQDTAEAILRDISIHPKTARFISQKLAEYFISDQPPDRLVTALADSFIESKGELLPLYETLVLHPDSMSSSIGKFKTPLDFVASSIRGLGATGKDMLFWYQGLTLLGFKFWAPPSPEGWSSRREDWFSSDSIKTRLDLAVATSKRATVDFSILDLSEQMLGARLLEDTKTAIRRAASPQQAISILLMSPEFQIR